MDHNVKAGGLTSQENSPQHSVTGSNETPSELSKVGYNAGAQTYHDWTSSVSSPRLEWIDRLFQQLGTAILPSVQILELGCGAGTPATIKFAQTVGHVTATDISSSMLALADKHLANAGVSRSFGDQEEGAKVSIIESDMLDLAFEDCRFHAVVALYSIIHLKQDDQITMMRRVFDWLLPNGCFLFNITAAPNEGNVNEWLGMKGFWAGLGPEKTYKVLEEIGFKVVQQDTISAESDSDFTWIIARKFVRDTI